MRLLILLSSCLLLAACGSGASAASPRADSQPAARPAEPQSAVAPTPTPEPATSRGKVVLVPIGAFPDDLTDAVEDALEEEFSVEVERHEKVGLPSWAYYKPRRRYRAEKLLRYLHEVVPDPDPDIRVLGLTSVDISTTKGKYKDWGIFGYGELPGKTSVISMYRLKRKAKDREHLTFRVTTSAIHEIGHTFGLDHCPVHRCAMEDARGSIENTDTSTGHVCDRCRGKLEKNYPLH